MGWNTSTEISTLYSKSVQMNLNLRLDFHFPQICRIKCLVWEYISTNIIFFQHDQPVLIIKCKDVKILFGAWPVFYWRVVFSSEDLARFSRGRHTHTHSSTHTLKHMHIAKQTKGHRKVKTNQQTYSTTHVQIQDFFVRCHIKWSIIW